MALFASRTEARKRKPKKLVQSSLFILRIGIARPKRHEFTTFHRAPRSSTADELTIRTPLLSVLSNLENMVDVSSGQVGGVGARLCGENVPGLSSCRGSLSLSPWTALQTEDDATLSSHRGPLSTRGSRKRALRSSQDLGRSKDGFFSLFFSPQHPSPSLETRLEKNRA